MPLRDRRKGFSDSLQLSINQEINSRVMELCRKAAQDHTPSAKKLYVFLIGNGEWRIGRYNSSLEIAKTEISKKCDVTWQNNDIFQIPTTLAIQLINQGLALPNELHSMHSWANVSISVGLAGGFVWMLTDKDVVFGEHKSDIAKPIVYAFAGACCFMLLELIGFYLVHKRVPAKPELQKISTIAGEVFLKLIFSIASWTVAQQIAIQQRQSKIVEAFFTGALDASFVTTINVIAQCLLQNETPSRQIIYDAVTLFITEMGAGMLWSLVDSFVTYPILIKSIINGVVIAAEFFIFYQLIETFFKKCCNKTHRPDDERMPLLAT